MPRTQKKPLLVEVPECFLILPGYFSVFYVFSNINKFQLKVPANVIVSRYIIYIARLWIYGALH